MTFTQFLTNEVRVELKFTFALVRKKELPGKLIYRHEEIDLLKKTNAFLKLLSLFGAST